jgi:ribosome-associated translation inhibitor RaiA
MSEHEPDRAGILEELRLEGGFGAADRPRVLEALAGLAKHLARWSPEQVQLEVAVKDRDGPDQRVTLQAFVAGLPHLVATSNEVDLDRALVEVRKELIRQVEDSKTRREPTKGKATRKPAS